MSDQQNLARLQNEPLYLLQLICWNNPEAVNHNLKHLELIDNYYDPDTLVQACLEIAGERPELLHKILRVEFNPHATNESADYAGAIKLRMIEVNNQGHSVLSPFWSSLFSDTVSKINTAYRDFVGDAEAEATESVVKTSAPKPPCGCQRKKNQMRDYGAYLAIMVIVVLIVKHW